MAHFGGPFLFDGLKLRKELEQMGDTEVKIRNWLLLLALICALISPPVCYGQVPANQDLRVLIIRHGEKPKTGENLTCQGENRARQLPATLSRKFGKIDYIYVPTVVSQGGKTQHARMFQTATPVAIRNGLDINSEFSGKEFDLVAQSVLEKKGTVLLVWNHTSIAKLAQSLGVSAPDWKDADFDGILVIRYPNGKAVLERDAEELSPLPDCGDH